MSEEEYGIIRGLCAGDKKVKKELWDAVKEKLVEVGMHENSQLIIFHILKTIEAEEGKIPRADLMKKVDKKTGKILLSDELFDELMGWLEDMGFVEEVKD